MNILQCTGQAPTGKNDLFVNISSAKVEKPQEREWVWNGTCRGQSRRDVHFLEFFQ